MAFNHARVYYGKYLDDISTLIDPAHYIVEEFSEIGHEVEPGEPNIPKADEASIVLANLDPEGNQRYPYSFWLSERRTPEEGGTLAMEIFFRIEVGGQTEFIGVYDSTSYGIRDEKVTINIKDLLEIFREDKRNMLSSFELFDLEIHELGGPNDSEKFNLLPSLDDHLGKDIPHEAITFELIGEVRTTRGADRVVSDDPAITFSHPWLRHIGAVRGAEIDITRNMYVQIGDTTIFTKCRYWSESNTAGRNTSQFFYLTIYHSKYPVENGIIPRGRFFRNDDLEALEVGDTVNLSIHDYSVPDPISGEYASRDTVITDADLPAYQNFIFGCSYVESGGSIELSTERYSYFDVVAKTLGIFENYFADRFGSGGQSGTITVKNDAPSDVGAGTEPSYTITVDPDNISEDVAFRIVADRDYWHSELIQLVEGMGQTAVRDAIIQGINTGQSNVNWDAVATSASEITVTGKQKTARHNGFIPFPSPFVTLPDVMSISSVSGGADPEISGGINIQIGDTIDVTTSDINAGETKESIAGKIEAALDADGIFAANYTSTLSANEVLVDKITPGERVSMDAFPGNTGVQVETSTIINRFDLFDLSKLIDRNRYAFFSDPIFFGWIDSTIAEVLVGVAWQTTCYLYTTSEGKIALHSRDWYEENIDDVYIDAGSYSQLTLLDQDLEPTSGIDREDGFQSYSLKHPIDIIEINNLESKQETTIIAGGLEVVKEVEIIDRSGGTRVVEQVSRYPASKNQKLKTSNFRIGDLGVPSQNLISSEDEVPILRLSPLDPAWPFVEDIDDFLPTPKTQLFRFYNSFKWPVETINAESERNIYPGLHIGDYVALENLNLYLVKNLSMQPGSLLMTMTLEFKKGLVNESITADTTNYTADTTNITADHT